MVEVSVLGSKFVSAVTALALVVGQVGPAFSGAPMSRADYEACQSGDEAAFRAAVEALTLKSLQASVGTVDFKVAVDSQWRKLSLDEVLDKRIDLAVEEVRAETGWSGLAQSLVNKEKAQELATKVAERVYQSDAVRQSIETLAEGIGKDVGQTIELASQDAAGPALECLRSFLGPRYGTTVAGVVSGNVESDFGLAAGQGGASVSSGAVLKHSSDGIAGAAIILVRRQLANMTARIGQRLAGAVLSRLVSVVAGGVGLVLIAKDLWELRNGVLPIIAGEMKSQATKDTVRAELATTIKDQIGEHVREIASKSSDRVIEIWHSFRAAHQKVLDLSGASEPFRAFVDSVRAENLARLDEVVDLIVKADGDPGVLKRLDDGSLKEAVRFMPEAAMTIARDTQSVDMALGWSALAGDRLSAVLEHEIYRGADPKDFTRASLTKLLALDDHLAISRLAVLPQDARERLFGLETGSLKRLARSFSGEELATLSSYLTGLEEGPRERVLQTVSATPQKMQVLASARVRDGILKSRDQTAAVDLMLREGGGSADVMVRDVQAAYDGRISPILIWEKHTLPVLGLGLLALFTLFLLRRLFRRRPSPKPATPGPAT